MIITIDGPAGSGKSTAARALARRLGFAFLDTGAMYRVVAEACLRRGIDVERDSASTAEVAGGVSIEFAGGRVLADGCDVTAAIRTAEVTRAASQVAVIAEVRAALARLQRRHARGRSVVTEGRDQGTFVFPDAECKFFLSAAASERARRRHRELQASGEAAGYEDVLEQLRERDRRDERRTVAPLRPAADAVPIDSTDLSPEQLVDQMEAVVRARMPQSPAG